MTNFPQDQPNWTGSGGSGAERSPEKAGGVSLVRHLPTGAFLVDGEGAIREVNQLVLDYLGVAREEILDQSYQKLFQAAIKQAVHPQKAREELRIGVKNLERQPLISLELDGQRRSFYEIRLFPLERVKSEPGGWGGLVIERTSEQHLKEEREREAYSLARQIRKELSSVSGNVQALAENHRVWEDVLVAEFLEDIHSRVGEISLLLNQHLDLLAINQDKLTVYPRAYSLKKVLEQTLSRIISQERSLKIDLQLPADLPAVRIDPDQMDRVFGYLVQQAAALSSDSGGIQITASPEGNWVQVAITGPRLSPRLDPKQNSGEKKQPSLTISKKNRPGPGRRTLG